MNNIYTLLMLWYDYVPQSDVVLVMTCAVRDGAEQKIWNRLEYLKSLKKNRSKHKTPFNIGILGKAILDNYIQFLSCIIL